MSAVIYAAIVVMWAVVLVPMWLRRHDAATESRSVDRFSTAMRTLSRRTTSGPGRRYVVMPRRSAGGVSVHVSGAAAPEPKAQPTRRAQPARRTQPATAKATRPRTSLVARRRRLLLGLLGLTLFTMLLASVGVLSWALQVVVDVILVAFCIHLRAQVKRATAISKQGRAPLARGAGRAATAPTPRRPANRPAARPRPAAEGLPVDEPLEATGTDDDTWQPVPVPRPTYTLKPPAPVEIPSDIVDPFRDTDPYNTMAPVYEEPLAPGSEVIAAESEVIDSDLEEILDRRWAVND